MYVVKISNLVHTYFNINVTSEENQLLTPRFAEMLTLKYRPLQNRSQSHALAQCLIHPRSIVYLTEWDPDIKSM